MLKDYCSSFEDMDGVESLNQLEVFGIDSCANEIISCQSKVYIIVFIINVKITFTCNEVVLFV